MTREQLGDLPNIFTGLRGFYTYSTEVTPKQAYLNRINRIRREARQEAIVLEELMANNIPTVPNVVRISPPLQETLSPHLDGRLTEEGLHSYVLIPPLDGEGEWQVLPLTPPNLPEERNFLRLEKVNRIWMFSRQLERFLQGERRFDKGVVVSSRHGNWLLLRNGDVKPAPSLIEILKKLRRRTNRSNAVNFEPALWAFAQQAKLELYKIPRLNGQIKFMFRGVFQDGVDKSGFSHLL